MSTGVPFMLEAFVDFPDDALKSPVPITPEHIDAMMAALAARGVRRVDWGYYGDGHGGWFIPSMHVEKSVDAQGEWLNHAATYQTLGNPLKVAAEAAHRHGMELYAYYKPYETGCAMVFPEGSLEASIDRGGGGPGACGAGPIRRWYRSRTGQQPAGWFGRSK